MASSGPQPSSRRRVSITDSRRHGGLDQVQLDLLEPAAGRGQLVLVGRALSTQLLQPGAAGPDGFELAPVPLPQLGQGRVQPVLGRATTAVVSRATAVASASSRFRRSAAWRRSSACPVNLRSTSWSRSAQDPPAFDQAGRADLPLAAERGGLGDPLVDSSALLTGRRGLFRGLGPRASSRPGSSSRSPAARATSRAIRSSSSAWSRRASSSSAASATRSSATRWRAARAVWWATSFRSSARTASSDADPGGLHRGPGGGPLSAASAVGHARPSRPGPGPRPPPRR